MAEGTNRAELQNGPSIRRRVKGWDDIDKTYRKFENVVENGK